MSNKYEDAELTHEQIQKFIKWLEVDRGAKDFACTVCGKNDWEVTPHLVSVPAFSAKVSIQPSRFVYPHVMILCKHCSHAVFFSAVRSGIVTLRDGVLLEGNGRGDDAA